MNREAINYQISINRKIENFCRPLNEYLGIALFIYFRVYHDDFSYSMLTNNSEATKEYCSKITTDIIYFEKYLKHSNKSKLIFWPKDPASQGMDLYYNLGYWHGLSVVTQEKESTETVCFLSTKGNDRINEVFLKYHPVLEKFTNHFKISFTEEIANSKIYKARYSKGYNLGIPEFEPNYIVNIEEFLKATALNKRVIDRNGKYITLTERENQCMELIDQGHSAKTIAKELLISPRTVESHIINIKDKTGYTFKKDLIKLYRDSKIII